VNIINFLKRKFVQRRKMYVRNLFDLSLFSSPNTLSMYKNLENMYYLYVINIYCEIVYNGLLVKICSNK
jgi:hypothetical protein